MYCEIGDAVQLPYKKRRFGIWASPTGVAVVGRVVIIVIFCKRQRKYTVDGLSV